jgi:hypothetical protein
MKKRPGLTPEIREEFRIKGYVKDFFSLSESGIEVI